MTRAELESARMSSGGLLRECADLEWAIEERISDFSAAYMAVCDLHSLVRGHPEVVRQATVLALVRILEDRMHATQKLALFFYREAAEALAAISAHERIEPGIIELSIGSLKSIAAGASGAARRAAAEAMGGLPLSIVGPDVNGTDAEEAPCISWQEVMERAGVSRSHHPSCEGRSLCFPARSKGCLFVVKRKRTDEPLGLMAHEAAWMEYLRGQCASLPVRFDVPAPLRVKGRHVFRLRDTPNGYNGCRALDPKGYAIAFFAHRDYFAYVNDHRPGRRLQGEQFREAIHRNGWLLGRMASSGIVHSAPIPLFHNRIQVNRRADRGLYEWPRGGRLDRWLASCRYPNFGLTGLRDFEHFCAFRGTGKELYQHIGSHLLSLLLVTGSYFRNLEAQRVGYDEHGRPVDARDLFDELLLEELVRAVFFGYYRGFVGRPFEGAMPFGYGELARRMVEEMGVDRHMEEILRARDQENMTESEFRELLLERGYSLEGVSGMRKGAEDIVLQTGPHLGGFNQRISLPELIDLVATASAVCVADRYLDGRLRETIGASGG